MTKYNSSTTAVQNEVMERLIEDAQEVEKIDGRVEEMVRTKTIKSFDLSACKKAFSTMLSLV